MSTMKALRQKEKSQPLEIEEVPIPEAPAGTAVLRVLATGIVSYMREIYDGTRQYTYPTPLTAGSSAVGRIHAVGPDATSLKKDQLVLFDITVRSRDDPTHVFLSAIHDGVTPGSKSLMKYWRNGSYAEYIAVPLENVFTLNESLLLGSPASGGMGYSVIDLLTLTRLLVPWGGLVDIGLRPSETVVIGPATGPFGGGACYVALAMGARVIAMGRNTDRLADMTKTFNAIYPTDRFTTVPIIGDVDAELEKLTSAFGPNTVIDAYFDIAPPQAVKSTHLKAAILSLRHSGRISFMGGQREDVAIPYGKVMLSNLNIRGKWMYERSDVPDLIRFVERGNLKLGEKGGFKRMKEYKLEEWKDAFNWAFDHADEGGAAFVL